MMDPPTYPFEETSFMDGPLFQTETQTYTKFLEHNVEAMVANASCVPESDKGLR